MFPLNLIQLTNPNAHHVKFVCETHYVLQQFCTCLLRYRTIVDGGVWKWGEMRVQSVERRV